MPSPDPLTSKSRWIGRFLRSSFAPPLLTAALLWMSFFPVNWGWLGWAALVPLLSVVADPLRPRACLAAWVGGLAFGLPAVQWMRLASTPMYATWIAMALFLSLHFLLFAWMTRKLLAARVPLLLAAPAAWTALEYLRAHIGIGFAWYYLGHTQHSFLVLLQSADLFGAYGLSFLVALVNVVIYQTIRALLTWRRARRQALTRWDLDEDDPSLPVALPSWPRLGLSLLLAAVLVAFGIGYGQRRLRESRPRPGPTVALLQGNLPQDIRNDPDEVSQIERHFMKLASQALAGNPNLIIWSETSFMPGWFRVAQETDWDTVPESWKKLHRESTELARQVSRAWPVSTLLGVESFILEPDGERHYNSALLIGPEGLERARYDKTYLIPFGEYLPWGETLPFMRWLSPYEGNYGVFAGNRLTLFELPGNPGHRFAVLICYEDTVPHLCRAFMTDSVTPDFLVNISNDGWFKGSEEHEQHLVAAIFRAVECRRSMVRSVNMGISCVIDSNGRVLAALGPTWRQSKAVEGVVTAAVPLDRRQSLYVSYGDLLPWACWLVCLPGVAMGVFLSLRQRQEPPTA